MLSSDFPEALERPRPLGPRRVRRGAWPLVAASFAALVVGCPPAPPPTAPGSGQIVRGSGYTVELPNASWTRVAIPADDTSGADFRLTRARESAWVVAFQTSGSAIRLESMVALRRSRMIAAGARAYRETRSFLGGDTDVVSSLARYADGRDVVLVLTAVRGPVAVELVAGTSNGSGVEREVLEVLHTLRFASPERSP